MRIKPTDKCQCGSGVYCKSLCRRHYNATYHRALDINQKLRRQIKLMGGTVEA